MAILVSPSNNSGWGLGCKSMYGGARTLSEHYPVLVRRHFRASWGSRKGRVPVSTMTITDDPVADVVNAIAEGTVRRRRRLRRRRRVSSAVRAARALVRSARRRLARRGRIRRTRNPVADVVRAVEEVARATPRRRSARISARAAAAAAAVAAATGANLPPPRPRARNVYWVRDQNGVRVPVTSRPPQQTVGIMV